MISSMTGYGRGVCTSEDLEVVVEIRSVNNRFLDISSKLPKSLSNYEGKIREIIGKKLSRGRVNLWISFSNGDEKNKNFKLNKNIADAYLRIAAELQSDFKVEGKVDINQLLNFPDIIEIEDLTVADEYTWHCTQEALNTALDAISNMRRQEGEELRKDFVTRISNLEKLVAEIEKNAANGPSDHIAKLRERVEKIITSENVDEGRLEMELAMMADRLDVTEECVRFHSHNKLFLDTLNAETSEGRKLNFLLQEMNREANTIGTKAASSVISHLVVQIKEEVERIREQVQNVA